MKTIKKILCLSLALLTSFAIMPLSNINAAEDKDDAKNKKEETVYSITDASGKTTSTIVSAWLQNNTKAKTIADKTVLSKVENVKGKQKYTTSNGVNTWKANGKDIYYQGNSKTAAPVGVKVTYYLNDKQISAADLKGKSGNVKIHYEYSNTAKETVNGKSVYVPFLMVTGMVMDNDVFSNVTIDNGKVISDGDRSVVVGYGLPGVKEDLGINNDSVNLDSFTVSASAKKFKLTNTLTYASSEVMNELDLSKVSSINSLSSAINQLSSSANQLQSGASALSDGIATLGSKIPALVSGVNQLDDGASQLVNGEQQLGAGLDTLYAKVTDATTGLPAASAGAAQLADGINQINAAVTAMNGWNQVINKTLTGISTNMTALSKELNGASSMLGNLTTGDGSLTTMSAYLSGLADKIAATNPDDAKQLKTYSQILSLESGIAGGLSSALSSSNANGYNAALLKLQAAVNTLQNEVNNGMQVSATQTLPSLSSIASAISAATNTTDGKLYLGAKLLQSSLGNATTQLEGGVNQLSDGVAQLLDGTGKLKTGTSALKSGATTLTSGVAQLQSGSATLSAGMTKFNQEGIQKLVSIYNGDVKSLLSNMESVVKAGQAYNSFTGLSDNMNGSVKFVIETDSIE